MQAVAGDHWAGVGVLVAAKEGAWLLKPTRAPEKVSPVFVFVFDVDVAVLYFSVKGNLPVFVFE